LSGVEVLRKACEARLVYRSMGLLQKIAPVFEKRSYLWSDYLREIFNNEDCSWRVAAVHIVVGIGWKGTDCC
jgi:hypothetical protein